MMLNRLKYVEKVARLGFDVIEIAAHHLNGYSEAHIAEIGRSARANGIAIMGGWVRRPRSTSPRPTPPSARRGGLFRGDPRQYRRARSLRPLRRPPFLPADRLFQPVDKPGDRARGVEGISSLADFAANHGVNLCLEVLNRFENHVLNTAEEGVAFVREVGKPNVKVHLDTFHMNIEEDSFAKAIHTAGSLLGHFQTGENDRRVPGKGRPLARDRNGVARNRL